MSMVNPFDINPLNTGPAAPSRTPVVAPKPVKLPFAATPLGVATNTVTGLPKAALDTGVNIARGLASDANAIGRTAANTEGSLLDKYVIKKPNIPTYPASAQLPKSLQGVFGSEPIKVLPKQVSDIKASIEASPIAQKLGINHFAGPIAVGAVLGQNILDFAPLGGEGGAVKALAKETDPEIISTLLQKTGVHPDIATKFAPEIAASKDPKEIQTILHTIKGTTALKAASEHAASAIPEGAPKQPYIINAKGKDLANIKNIISDVKGFADPDKFDRIEIQNVGKTKELHTILLDKAAEQTPSVTEKTTIPESVHPEIPKELHLLAEEARKYKSADEFIASKQPVYHGTDAKFSEFDPEKMGTIEKNHAARNSFFFSDNKETAKGYGKQLKEAYLDFKKPVTIDAEGKMFGDMRDVIDDAVLEAKKSGNDGVIIKNLSDEKDYSVYNPSTHFAVIDTNAIKTRKQLEDLYTQATKGAGESTPDISYIPTDEESAMKSIQDSADTNLAPEAEPEVPEEYKNQITSEEPSGATEEPVQAYRTAQGVPIDPTLEKQFKERLNTPAATLKKSIDGPDKKSWESLIKGYSKNLPTEQKAHLLDYMGTPEFVLEKLGLQKGAEMLQDAKDTYRTTLKKELKTILDWKQKVGRDPYAKIRIFRYLDGDARYAKSEMSATEVEVAKEIKTYLKDWATRLKLPEDKQISQYITHIFDKDAVGLPKESAFEDPDLATIMESTPAKSVYNPFKEARVNKPGYKEDVWAALDAYVKRGSREEAMTPALEAISQMAHRINANAYEYVTHLTHQINMRPQWIDEKMDNLLTEKFGNKFTQRPTAYLSKKIRSLFYRGSLGLNVTSALRNLSQGANTYAKLGERYTTVGYFSLVKNLVTRNLHELYDQGILDDAVIQDKKVGVYKSILQKADPALFTLFDFAEKINRGSAYYGAKARAIDKGLSEGEAIKYAKRIVRETQFAFGAIDTPIGLGSDFAKTALQMQSYSVKQGEFIGRMVSNKEWGGLIRYSLASLLFINTIGKLFGMNVMQLIPSVGLNSPLTTTASGAFNAFLGNSTQAKQQGKSQLQTSLAELFPAGVQARKTIQGLEDYSAEADKTPSGNVRFNVKKTPSNLVRGALFGKAGFPEEQAYYRALDSKGKKKAPTGGANPLNI